MTFKKYEMWINSCTKRKLYKKQTVRIKSFCVCDGKNGIKDNLLYILNCYLFWVVNTRTRLIAIINKVQNQKLFFDS